MSLNLSAVVVESSKKSGESFTDAEKSIARESVTAVIKELGGVPTTAEGKDSFGHYVNKIKAECLATGNVPAKYEGKGRSWSSYAHLAKVALAALRAEATASKAKGKVA